MRWRTLSRVSWCVVLPALVVVTACGQPGESPPGDEARGTLPVSQAVRAEVVLADAGAVSDVVAAADVMGLELISGFPDQTAVTSPVGLQVALSMAAEGAEGDTLAQLEAIIGAEGTDRREAINALTATLEEFEGDPAVVQEDELPETPVVHRADRLVMDDSLVVKRDFVDALTVNYGATAEVTDLAGPEGQATLDEWVKEHSGGLVPQSAIEPSTGLRLVLQDAIVLAAGWQTPFAAALTEPRSFTLPDGDEVAVDMMTTAVERDTLHAEVDGWQAVRLPYSGGRLHADIILPPLGAKPTDISPDLLAALQGALGQAGVEPVVISMPVADTKSTLDLVPYLAEHTPAALEGGFGGITDEGVAINQAVQQGVLKIDEEGTVAAVVTEISFAVSGRAEPPTEFTVDRPYLVRIADGDTGWPLFLAHITDPRSDDT